MKFTADDFAPIAGVLSGQFERAANIANTRIQPLIEENARLREALDSLIFRVEGSIETARAALENK